MKRTFLSLVMLIAVVSAPVFPEFTGSFLSTGTAGLFKNEADAAVGEATFNGIGYFTSMSGRIGLYTNFMNGQGGNEELFGNVTNDKYFLGVSGNLIRLLEKLNTAAFVELDNANNARNILSKANAGASGLGYYSWSGVTYDALSGLNETETEENTNEQTVRANSWLVNNTYQLFERVRLGLLVAHEGNGTEDCAAPFNSFNAANGYGYAAGDAKYTYGYNNGQTVINESGEFASTADMPQTRIAAGANLGLGLLTVDAFAILNLMADEGDSSSAYAYNENSPTASITESESQASKGDMGLTSFTVGGAASKDFLDKRISTRLAADVSFGGGTADYKKDDSYSLNEVAKGAPLSATTTISETRGNAYSGGDVSLFGYGLCLTGFFKIDDNLRLGLGLGYDYMGYERLYTLAVTRHRVETFNDGDAQVSDPDDYTQTTTYGYGDVRTKLTADADRIRLPAGFTWDVTPKWQFRAGAVHTIENLSILAETEEMGPNTESVLTQYGDNTSTTVNNTVNPQTVGSEVDGAPSNSLTSGTDFMYGIGFHPIKNLTVDFDAFLNSTTVGQQFMLDLDWYRSLRLSITFFFDPAPAVAAE